MLPKARGAEIYPQGLLFMGGKVSQATKVVKNYLLSMGAEELGEA